MHKNQDGFGAIEVILVLFLITLVVVASWVMPRTRNNSNISKTKLVTDPSLLSSKNKTSQQGAIHQIPPKNIDTKDYPRPTAPTNLKVASSGGGYLLTWQESVGTGAIVKYQVFNKGILVAEPTITSYKHQLPPPPPSCNPIPMTYTVKAVDGDGSISDPSNSVTVYYGGNC